MGNFSQSLLNNVGERTFYILGSHSVRRQGEFGARWDGADVGRRGAGVVLVEHSGARGLPEAFAGSGAQGHAALAQSRRPSERLDYARGTLRPNARETAQTARPHPLLGRLPSHARHAAYG
jgi:hypothetical protein